MKTEAIGALLRSQWDSAATVAPERTVLHDVAQDNLGMVMAYLLDGETFLASGDPVNALAAFCYAMGWFHCGIACGFFSILQKTPCPFGDSLEVLPAAAREKLTGKAYRYEHLLATACAAVTPAAEEGTVPYFTADRISCAITVYAGQGSRFLAQGKYEDALSCFSYGHGWLDAGVRAGLFSVHARRDLFTI